MLFKTATRRNIYSIVACGVVATIATAGVLFSVSYSQIRATSIQSMDAAGQSEAKNIAETFKIGNTLTNNLSTALVAMKASGTADRDKADMLLQGLLANNSFALGVWTGWDANAFDGKDADFVGKPAHDTTGRYLPYWVRSDGKIIHEVLVDYDKPGAGDYYIVAHDTQKPAIVEPYIYPVGGKDVLMTSIVSPVIIDGKSQGVAGMDMALDDLHTRLAAIRPFGTGTITLLSEGGVVVSAPDAEMIGKSLKDSGLSADMWTDLIKNHDKPVDLTDAAGEANIAISVPVQLLPNETWTAVIMVPKATLFADLNQTMWISAIIVAIATVLLVAAGYLLSSGFQNRIRRIIDETSKVAAGELSINLTDADRKDELGDLARSVQVLRNATAETARLHDEAGAASRQRAQDRELLARQQEQQAAEIQLVIDELGNGLNRLADGDVTVQLTKPFNGSMEKLRIDFNQSVGKLHEALQAFAHSASAIHAGSEEIRHAADDLSRRTEQQAASVEETAAALEQITTSVKDSTKRAEDVGKLVDHTRQGAEHSGQVVTSAVEAMSQIEKSSHEISNIIGVIDEIAFQTNLLALNAGVEAARAGDAGKGFAVVAQEVRELAQRSASAAKEIKNLINSSGEQVKRGVSLVGETGAALTVISAEVQEINNHIQTIVLSAREQSNGLAEINNAVNLIDQGTQKNAAMVEESNAASHSLATEATSLNQQLAKFQLGNGQAARQPVRAPQAVTANHKPQATKSPVAPMMSKISKAFGGRSTAAAAVQETQQWEDF